MWFVSAMDYLEAHRSAEDIERVVAGLLPPHRAIAQDPLPSQWYPEEALQDLIAALHHVLCDDDDDTFRDLCREVANHGFGRFFRLLASLSSPRFVFRQLPTIWGLARRSGAEVTTETSADGAILHVRNFPYYADPRHRMLNVGTMLALCDVAGCKDPAVRVLDHGADWIDVEIRFEAG